MLNIWELRTLPPPPSAGPTVRVCRYVMDFNVVLESVCEISMRHKTLRPYVITWEKTQKAAFSLIYVWIPFDFRIVRSASRNPKCSNCPPHISDNADNKRRG